jgi:hypothetical protein
MTALRLLQERPVPNRVTVHFDRSEDGRSYLAWQDGIPDTEGEGDTMIDALRSLRAALLARRIGAED